MTSDELLLLSARVAPRTRDEPAVDVRCAGGRVVEIGTGLEPGPDAAVEDLDGRILLPSFTDTHAHLDSTRLGLPFRPHTAGPGLAGLVANDRAHWRDDPPVADRATYTLGVTIVHGTTRVRSHAQVDPDTGLERLEGVLAARQAHADRCGVEIVAFPQTGILRSPGTADLLDAALRSGADLVGGIDPAGFDGDPVRHLDVVFDLAERHDCGIDVHLHDEGTLGAWQVEAICARTVATGMQGRVTISHGFGVSTVPPARTAALVERLAEADVALTTVAPGTRPPLPVDQLLDAGVRVGLGQDGIRDHWSPWGSGDMLERTWQLAHRSGLRADADIERCVAVATTVGASVLGTADATVAVGGPADLVAVRGDTVTAAVMDRAGGRVVVRAGRVVARGEQLVSS